MMKLYQITLPTPDRCRELGLKFEGQETRTRIWLMGVAQGVSFCSSDAKINLRKFTRNSVELETNSQTLVDALKTHLGFYGCTLSEQIPNCPVCRGERECDATPGVYWCGFCGSRTT